MKILLLGKNGLLGNSLNRILSETEEVFATSKEECDILNPEAVKRAIMTFTPEVVINATGYTKVDLAEDSNQWPELYAINAYALDALSRICKKTSTALVHFSTDYVFDGKTRAGYKESSIPSPLNEYGKSKALGEEFIHSNMNKFYLIRTSWLFGPGGKNFVDTMINLAATQPNLRVVNDQFGKPTYTEDLAKALYALLKSRNYGIYHIVNEGETTWYDFAKEIMRVCEEDKQVVPITSSELNQRASRPTYSSLINTKLRPLRPWREALKDYITTSRK